MRKYQFVENKMTNSHKKSMKRSKKHKSEARAFLIKNNECLEVSHDLSKQLSRIFERIKYEIQNIRAIRGIQHMADQKPLKTDFSFFNYKKSKYIWFDPKLDFGSLFHTIQRVAFTDLHGSKNMLNPRQLHEEQFLTLEIKEDIASMVKEEETDCFIDRMQSQGLITMLENSKIIYMKLFVENLHVWKLKNADQLGIPVKEFQTMRYFFQIGLKCGLYTFYILTMKYLIGESGYLDEYHGAPCQNVDRYKDIEETVLNVLEKIKAHDDTALHKVCEDVLPFIYKLKRICVQQGMIMGIVFYGVEFVSSIFRDNQVIHDMLAGYIHNPIIAICFHIAIKMKIQKLQI